MSRRRTTDPDQYSLADNYPAAPEGPVVRVRATVAYDGSEFRGFAPNDGVRTVGGSLRDALERVLGHRVELTCAGRTDSGVHGWGQVISFDATADRFDAEQLSEALNGICGPTIAVREVVAAEPDFDARFSATRRTYRYTVLNSVVPNPFVVSTAWHVAQPLDGSAMVLACDPLIGEHDFAAFCRRPKRPDGDPEASLVRRVLDARWDDLGDGLLRFEITANAFCHQMVRSIVGLMVAVGRGKVRAGEVAEIIGSGDRSRVPDLAPPHGLCLWRVDFDGPRYGP
ncbi:MAG TPA: tRNA pseudouridine(38-40) synthase TruA [Acidimicrobiales bacterium]